VALQDLTPQLRTRLSRMERAVGWFVMLAGALLVFGFGYYVYNTAERKGWFKTKVPYFSFTASASGLKVGDPVTMMGLPVGQITRMEPQPPTDFRYNMYIQFEIQYPYDGYIWTEGSKAQVAPSGFLGGRTLEVTKGTGGYPTYIYHPVETMPLAQVQSLADLTSWRWAEEVYRPRGTNLLARPFQALTNLDEAAAIGHNNLVLMHTSERQNLMAAVWNDRDEHYEPFTRATKPYWLLTDEAPPVTEKLQAVVEQVEKALPDILGLTNQLAALLSNSTSTASNLNLLALGVRPVVSNLAAATAHLDQPGALGEWLLPTNVSRQLEGTLANANTTLTGVNTNLSLLVDNLSRSLDNLASMTSNLNQQVQSNTNLLGAISQTIVHADEFVQGLKHHWLLRSAFKTKSTNAPAAGPANPLLSPKDRGAR
jgi:ABC-type transporter Mla subunit MlaD